MKYPVDITVLHIYILIYLFILREHVISNLPSDTSISNADVGNTIYN